MRKTILAVAAAGALSTVAMTGALADHHESSVDTSAISSGSYSADSRHSLVGWKVDHLGFNDYLGLFGDVSGTLELDAENVENSVVDVTIPITSVVVASQGLHEHLLRDGEDGAAPDFFGSAPEAARFVSTSVERTGPDTANITGNLTLNGVTNEVTLRTQVAGMGTNMMSQKETVGFHAVARINRSEWNLGWGIPFGLGDEVGLQITVAFEKQ